MKYFLLLLFVPFLFSCSSSTEKKNDLPDQNEPELKTEWFVDYTGTDSIQAQITEYIHGKCWCFVDTAILECEQDSTAHCFTFDGDKSKFLYYIEVNETMESDTLIANIQIFKNKPGEVQRILNAGDFNITRMNSLDEFQTVAETIADLIVKVTFK